MPKEKNAPENYEAFIKKVREKLIFKTIKRGDIVPIVPKYEPSPDDKSAPRIVEALLKKKRQKLRTIDRDQLRRVCCSASDTADLPCLDPSENLYALPAKDRNQQVCLEYQRDDF